MMDSTRVVFGITETSPDVPRVYFAYKPEIGLLDIDFHVIIDRNWSAMESPSDDAVAELHVTPQTTVEQLNEVITALAVKGGYKHIEIAISP